MAIVPVRACYDNHTFSEQAQVSPQRQEATCVIPEKNLQNHFTIGVTQLVVAIIIAINEIVGFIMRFIVFVAFYWGIGIWVAMIYIFSR